MHKKKQTIFSFSSVFQCLRVDLDELIRTDFLSQSSMYSDFTKKKKNQATSRWKGFYHRLSGDRHQRLKQEKEKYGDLK